MDHWPRSPLTARASRRRRVCEGNSGRIGQGPVSISHGRKPEIGDAPEADRLRIVGIGRDGNELDLRRWFTEGAPVVGDDIDGFREPPVLRRPRRPQDDDGALRFQMRIGEAVTALGVTAPQT